MQLEITNTSFAANESNPPGRQNNNNKKAKNKGEMNIRNRGCSETALSRRANAPRPAERAQSGRIHRERDIWEAGLCARNQGIQIPASTEQVHLHAASL